MYVCNNPSSCDPISQMDAEADREKLLLAVIQLLQVSSWTHVVTTVKASR